MGEGCDGLPQPMHATPSGISDSCSWRCKRKERLAASLRVVGHPCCPCTERCVRSAKANKGDYALLDFEKRTRVRSRRQAGFASVGLLLWLTAGVMFGYALETKAFGRGGIYGLSRIEIYENFQTHFSVLQRSISSRKNISIFSQPPNIVSGFFIENIDKISGRYSDLSGVNALFWAQRHFDRWTSGFRKSYRLGIRYRDRHACRPHSALCGWGKARIFPPEPKFVLNYKVGYVLQRKARRDAGWKNVSSQLPLATIFSEPKLSLSGFPQKNGCDPQRQSKEGNNDRRAGRNDSVMPIDERRLTSDEDGGRFFEWCLCCLGLLFSYAIFVLFVMWNKGKRDNQKYDKQ